MLGRLIEFVLPYVIGVVHRREALTSEERIALGVFRAYLVIHKHRTKKPVVVALIGLIGPGKILVAEEFSKQIGATIIDESVIRVELRKQKASYERTCAIAENVAIGIAEKGGNVVLNFNAIDMNNRVILRAEAKKAGIRLVFVRTYCDPETVKPPCDVAANINIKYEVYWKHEVRVCADELLA